MDELTPEEIDKAVYARCEEMGVKWVEILVDGDEERIIECGKAIAKAQLAKVHRERPDREQLREKIAIIKLCSDYGMTEDATRLCIQEDKIRQSHVGGAFSFADQILALFRSEEEIKQEGRREVVEWLKKYAIHGGEVPLKCVLDDIEIHSPYSKLLRSGA